MVEPSFGLPKFLRYMWLWCVLVRLYSACYVSTSFVPDEYWQSLEVAHKLAFGYGYLTWEWYAGIRSYFYPMMIAIIYKVLEMLRMDSVEMIVFMPRLMQAIASAVADFHFASWFSKTTGYHTAWGWFTLATSWFWFYCASRTLSNTMETVFTMLALSLYPWQKLSDAERTRKGNKSWLFIRRCREIAAGTKYLWYVGLACVIRPTALIVWIPMVVGQILSMKTFQETKELFKNYLWIFFPVLFVSTVLDSLCQGQLVFTWWNFFDINVNEGIGEFYGSHPFLWYLYCGLPVVMGFLLVPLILGILTSKNSSYKIKVNINAIMYSSIFFTLIIFSFLPHKEFRFLLPILPMCLHISACWLADWCKRSHVQDSTFVICFLLVASLVPSIYLGHHHQRGVLDVMPILAKTASLDPKNTDLLFLLPCHTTPLYSHLHVNVSARFLTCEPNLFHIKNYTDEADHFYHDPAHWLHTTYSKKSAKLPSHIICFDGLIPDIEYFLEGHQYMYEYKVWHTNFPSGRVSENVIIFSRYNF